MTLFYPDLSHYSWDRHGDLPDFAAIKAAGFEVICIRATYGDPAGFNPETRHFREMASAAKAAGLFVGGYHNLVRGDDASIARQVAYFKAELDAVGADWAMLDVEPYAALVANGLWPRLDDAVRFEQAWDATDEDRRLAVYLARWFWQRPVELNGLNSAPLTVLRGPLVSSNYPASTAEDPVARYAEVGGDAGPGWTPYGGKQPEVWQFSSQVTIPGVSSTEDVNAFRGDLFEFKKRMRKEDPVAWSLNKALTNFRKTVNARYPHRDKGSDGTIGDAAHLSRDSDHNQDPDGSVDAWDMDVELNGPGKPYADDLQKVIDAALKHESIQYVIYNRKITSRNKPGGLGRWHRYTGSNPHDKHVHFNTRESHENSTAPWHIEEDEMTEAQFVAAFLKALQNSEVADALFRITWRQDKIANPYGDKETNPYIWPETGLRNVGRQTEDTLFLVQALKPALEQALAKLAEGTGPSVQVDGAALADALAANPDFLAGLAVAVNEELARRQQA